MDSSHAARVCGGVRGGKQPQLGLGPIVRHGQGVYTTTGGMKYEGGWADNAMSGVGELVQPDGANYKGDFADNLFDGRGTFTFADGSSFAGQWSKNRPFGDGETSPSWLDTYFGHTLVLELAQSLTQITICGSSGLFIDAKGVSWVGPFGTGGSNSGLKPKLT